MTEDTIILIKFISPYPAGNVIASLAVNPDLLVPVGYGDFFEEELGERLNFIFKRRGLNTVVAGPVSLSRYMASEAENRLTEIFEQYHGQQIVIDISDADEVEMLALGCLLGSYDIQPEVLDYDIHEGILYTLRTGKSRERRSFPSLSLDELAYIRNGTEIPEVRTKDKGDYVRADLTPEFIREIRLLFRLFMERPAYWTDLSARLEETLKDLSPGEVSGTVPISKVTIPESGYENLRKTGLFLELEKSGTELIVRFRDLTSRELLIQMNRMPLFAILLQAASVTNIRGKAAYRELTLKRGTMITGIYLCEPVCIGVLADDAGLSYIYQFDAACRKHAGNPVRKILVKFGSKPVRPIMTETAEALGIELTTPTELVALLDPK